MTNSKAKKTIRFYNKLSKQYDSAYSTYLEHTHMVFHDWFEAAAGDKILDVSCGTGILGRELLSSEYQFKELVLNDPSPGMLKKAKEKIPDSGGVRFTSDYIEELSAGDSYFDRLVCLNAFHYYTDHDLALQHFSRVLKPGGVLYLQDWNLEGWFHIPNFMINLATPENINTASLRTLLELLPDYGFTVQRSEAWSFRFWKFYRIEAVLSES